MIAKRVLRPTCLLAAAALAALSGVGFLGGRGVQRAHAGGDDTGGGYLGSAVCLNCHQTQHALWSGASHAHTFERATADNLPAAVVGGRTVEHPPGRTRFLSEEGRFLAETAGPDGEPTRYHLSHVVGRMRIRMFVATLPDGRQQVLPSMLEVPTGAWFDYTHLLFGVPGEGLDEPPVVGPGEPSFWTGPVRSWDARCARCHVSGYQARRPGSPGRGARYGRRALGVDCESCHGPASEHVEFREAKMEEGDPILRFRDLAHERALGVCLQCHLEAEVVEPGFLPGDDVFEFRDPTLLLDPERVDPSGRPLELIYDGLPMSVSRCVAEGKLTCVSCHDPHGSEHASQLRLPPEGNGLCSGCHARIGADLQAHTHHEPAGSGSQCVGCHMPYLSIERGHGVVADHSISTPRFDLQGDRLAQNACAWCHAQGVGAPRKVPRLEPEALREAHARWWPDAAPPPQWMRALGAARLGRPDGHLALQVTLETRANPRLVRASAASLLGRYAAQAPRALLALARDPDSLVRRSALRALASRRGPEIDAALSRALADPSRAVRRAAARAALQGWTRVRENAALLQAILPVLREDAQQVPEDDMRWFHLGAALSLAGRDSAALAAYERVAELDPFADHVRKEIERLRKALR